MKEAEKEIKRWRRRIDQADRDLVKALAARFQAVKKIGQVKVKWGIPVVQSTRWNQLMRDRLKLAKKYGVAPALIKKINELIQKEAVSLQRKKRR